MLLKLRNFVDLSSEVFVIGAEGVDLGLHFCLSVDFE
jgi:hypothetical protein